MGAWQEETPAAAVPVRNSARFFFPRESGYPANVSKALTREQLEGRKEKAARFVRDVLADPERAEEIADESLEDYAARRKIEILDNPHRRRKRAMPTNKELQQHIRELEEENEELQDQLDAVADIVAPADEDEDEDEDEGEDADHAGE